MVESRRRRRPPSARPTCCELGDGNADEQWCSLPLADDTDIGIIGEFADHPRYQGAGSSQVVPTRLDDARRHAEERFTGSGRIRRRL